MIDNIAFFPQQKRVGTILISILYMRKRSFKSHTVKGPLHYSEQSLLATDSTKEEKMI